MGSGGREILAWWILEKGLCPYRSWIIAAEVDWKFIRTRWQEARRAGQRRQQRERPRRAARALQALVVGIRKFLFRETVPRMEPY